MDRDERLRLLRASRVESPLVATKKQCAAVLLVAMESLHLTREQ
jgi:hypothetical protein